MRPTFALPFALVALAPLLLAGASPAQEVTGGARVVPVERVAPTVRSTEPLVAEAVGLEAARAALANGDERAAASELNRAARLLRMGAARLDDLARGPVLDVATEVARIGAEVELGNVDEAQLDRRLASAMRSLAAHHVALARAALARDEPMVASEHLTVALDCFERALRWRGAVLDARTGAYVETAAFEATVDDARLLTRDLDGALALTVDVKRALDAVARAIDEEKAMANPTLNRALIEEVLGVPLAPADDVR